MQGRRESAVRYARSSPETAALRDFNPLFVGFGSNSAVSRFLQHGCVTPETGHCSARLGRQKSANSGHCRCSSNGCYGISRRSLGLDVTSNHGRAEGLNRGTEVRCYVRVVDIEMHDVERFGSCALGEGR